MPSAGTTPNMLQTRPLTKARGMVWRSVYGGIPMKVIRYQTDRNNHKRKVITDFPDGLLFI